MDRDECSFIVQYSIVSDIISIIHFLHIRMKATINLSIKKARDILISDAVHSSTIIFNQLNINK